MTELILFHLGSKNVFALPVRDVKEIVAMSPIHRWPGASHHFLGCMDVRGATVPIVDLPQLLLSRETQKSEGVVIILDLDQPYGLKVESVSSIAKSGVDSDSHGPSGSYYTDFVWEQDDGSLVQVLSTAKIIARITEKNVA